MIDVFIEICREEAILPKYANIGDAGMDVYAASDVLIKPSETKIVPLGFKVAIPSGFEIQVRPRSGISFNTPLRISNSPGTIDCGYRDEVGVLVTNTSLNTSLMEGEIFFVDTKGNKQGDYKVRKGDRIAQIVLSEVPVISFKVVNSVENIGSNRGGGIGSTGIK